MHARPGCSSRTSENNLDPLGQVRAGCLVSNSDTGSPRETEKADPMMRLGQQVLWIPGPRGAERLTSHASMPPCYKSGAGFCKLRQRPQGHAVQALASSPPVKGLHLDFHAAALQTSLEW